MDSDHLRSANLACAKKPKLHNTRARLDSAAPKSLFSHCTDLTIFLDSNPDDCDTSALIRYRYDGHESSIWLRRGKFVMRLVLAEDDHMLSELLRDFLSLEGFVVCGCARTADEAVALCNEKKPELGLFDYRLATSIRGTTIRPQIRDKSIGIIMVSGEPLQDLTKDSADLFIQKPYGLMDLGAALRTLCGLKEQGFINPASLPRGFRLVPEKVEA